MDQDKMLKYIYDYLSINKYSIKILCDKQSAFYSVLITNKGCKINGRYDGWLPN